MALWLALAALCGAELGLVVAGFGLLLVVGWSSGGRLAHRRGRPGLVPGRHLPAGAAARRPGHAAVRDRLRHRRERAPGPAGGPADHGRPRPPDRPGQRRPVLPAAGVPATARPAPAGPQVAAPGGPAAAAQPGRGPARAPPAPLPLPGHGRAPAGRRGGGRAGRGPLGPPAAARPAAGAAGGGGRLHQLALRAGAVGPRPGGRGRRAGRPGPARRAGPGGPGRARLAPSSTWSPISATGRRCTSSPTRSGRSTGAWPATSTRRRRWSGSSSWSSSASCWASRTGSCWTGSRPTRPGETAFDRQGVVVLQRQEAVP